MEQLVTLTMLCLRMSTFLLLRNLWRLNSFARAEINFKPRRAVDMFKFVRMPGYLPPGQKLR